MSELFGNEQAIENSSKLAENFENLGDKLEVVKNTSGALEVLYNRKINKTFENFTKVLGDSDEIFGKVVKQQNSAVKTGEKLNKLTGEFNKEVAKSETIFAKLFKTLNPVVKVLEGIAKGGLIAKGVIAIADGFTKVVGEIKQLSSALSILEKSGFNLSEVYGLQQFQDDILSLNTGGIEDFATTAVAKFTEVSSLLAQIGTLIPQELNEGLKKGEDVLGNYFDKYQEIVNTTLKNTVSSTDALKASYTALQAGFEGAAVDNVVNSSLKLLVAQGGDAEQIVALLKQTMTAFNLEASESGDILGKLNKVVDLGITTIPELQYGFGALGVSANTAGVSFDEMSASLVQLTKAGSTTSTAITKLNNLYNQITSGQITERLKDMGATFIENGKAVTATFDSQTIATKGFAKAAEDVYASLGKSNEKLRKALPDSEAFAAFTGVLTEGADGLQDVINQIATSGAKELEKAFKIRIDNDKVVQFSQVVNRASETVLKLGKVLAPVFDKGLDYIDSMVDKLAYLVENWGGVIEVVVKTSVAMNAFGAAVKAVLGTMGVLVGVFLQYQLLTGKLIGNVIELGKALINGGSATNKYNMFWNENVSITKKVLGSIGQLLGVYDIQKSKVESLTDAEREKIKQTAGATTKAIAATKEEISARDKQIAGLEEQIEKHRKRVAEIEKEIQANNRLSKVEQDAVKQRKALLQEQMKAAKAEIKLREDKIKTIEEEIAANDKLTDKQRENKNKYKSDLQKEVDNKKRELSDLQKKDEKLVTREPLSQDNIEYRRDLIRQEKEAAARKSTRLRNSKEVNRTSRQKLEALTERLTTEDPMSLLDDVLQREVKLNKPQSFKFKGGGIKDIGKSGDAIKGMFSSIATGSVKAVKGLGGILSMGLKLGAGLVSALLSPVAIITALAGVVIKVTTAFLDADKAAEKFAKKLNGDSDTVTTLGEQYKELGTTLASKLPKQFGIAGEAANAFIKKLKDIKNAIGEVLNGSGRRFNQIVPELDRAIADSQSYNQIEGKSLQRETDRLKKGVFRDVFVGDNGDERVNLSDFLGNLDKNNISREDSTRLADVIDKQRIDILKRKNTAQDQADTLLKKAETARELLALEGVTDEEINALKTKQELDFLKSNTVNSELIKRYENSGRDKTKLTDEENEIIGRYEALSSENKDNQLINEGLDKKIKENGKLEIYINRLNSLEQEAKTFTETSEAYKKVGEDTVAILDSINNYVKNLSDSEGTTNPYLSGLKRNIDNTLENTQKDVKLFEDTYDKFVNAVKEKGEEAAKELLTEEELNIIKNSQARFAKNAETILADVTAAVETQGITADEAAKKIREFLDTTDAGMLDKGTRQQLVQQERALLNEQYNRNVEYLEKLRTLYQKYGDNELIYNEQKFRKLQQLELQQFDEKIKQAELNYNAIKDDDEITQEEKNKRKIEIDILIDEKKLRQLEQAIALLEKQNEIQEKRLTLESDGLFLDYAKGAVDVYDELFKKQEQLRAKTLEGEIANLEKIRQLIQKRGDDTLAIDQKIASKQKELVAEYYAYAESLLNRYQQRVNNGLTKQNNALEKAASNLSINKDLLQGQVDVLDQQLALIEQASGAKVGDLEYAKSATSSRVKQIKLEKQIIEEQRAALDQKLKAEKISLAIKQKIRDVELEILQIQQQQAEAEAEAAYKNAVAENALAQSENSTLSPEEKAAAQLKEDSARNNLEVQLKQGQLLEVTKRLNSNQTAMENYGLRLSARQQRDAIDEREVAVTATRIDDIRYANERAKRGQIPVPTLQGVSDISIDQGSVNTKLDKVQQEAANNAKTIVDGYESSINKLKDPMVKEQTKTNQLLEKIHSALTGQSSNNAAQSSSSSSNSSGKSPTTEQQTIVATNVKITSEKPTKQKDTVTPRDTSKDKDLQEARSLAERNAPSEAFIKRLQGEAYDVNKKLEALDVQLQQPGLSKQQRNKIRNDKKKLKEERDATIKERDSVVSFAPDVEKQQQKVKGIAGLRQQRLERIEKRNQQLNKPTTPGVNGKTSSGDSSIINNNNSNNVAFSPQITINVNSDGKDVGKDVKDQVNDALYSLFNEVQRRQQA